MMRISGVVTFYIYVVSTIICMYGFGVFIWWWKKTSRATTIYMFMTALFGATVIERILHIWSGYVLVYLREPDKFVDIVLSPYWFFATLPSFVVFVAMTAMMTRRIQTTYKAATISPEEFRPTKALRNVLVISSVKATKTFLRGVFISNGVDYHQTSDLLSGFDRLVSSNPISVIMIGLSAVDDSGMRLQDVVKIIKKENPWSIVVAMSRTPNAYELFEVRRAFFDDYIYFPIKDTILMTSFERWIFRINRWRHIERRDRRAMEGAVDNRRGVETRRKKTECPLPIMRESFSLVKGEIEK